MAIVLDKLTELEYNELATLQLIEKNEDLLEMFYGESKIKFPMIYPLQKEGKLNENVRIFTKMIFEELIVTRQDFIDKYLHYKSLLNDDAVNDAVSDAVNDAVMEVIIEEEEAIEEPKVEIAPTVETKTKVTKPKTEKPKAEKPEKETEPKVVKPRRYGRWSIEADIKTQGFPATSQQRAGLKVADLKNIYVKLEGRVINDMLTDTPKLSVEDYRLITATIEIVENKLKEILKENNMEDQVNRKLFLQHEVFEIFTREKIQETIVYFEEVLKEIDEYLVVLVRVEDMLRAVDEDTTDTSEQIRILEIQKMYLSENLETFKDALSLCEDSIN